MSATRHGPSNDRGTILQGKNYGRCRSHLPGLFAQRPRHHRDRRLFAACPRGVFNRRPVTWSLGQRDACRSISGRSFSSSRVRHRSATFTRMRTRSTSADAVPTRARRSISISRSCAWICPHPRGLVANPVQLHSALRSSRKSPNLRISHPAEGDRPDVARLAGRCLCAHRSRGNGPRGSRTRKQAGKLTPTSFANRTPGPTRAGGCLRFQAIRTGTTV